MLGRPTARMTNDQPRRSTVARGLGSPRSISGFPGDFPYTRGIQPTMYRGRLWTMRQYAGFGTAAESNRRYRYLLAQGVTGLSVAFDLPTQMGYDSDHALAPGEVGRVGVAIDSIDDMAELFDGIPLDTRVDVDDDQRDGDHPARAVRRRREAAGRRARRRCRARSRTTSSRNTSRAAPTSIRRGRRCASSPTSSRSASASCRTGTRSRSAATTSARPARRRSQEVAFTFANAIAYVQAAIDAGLDVDRSASGCRSSSTPTTTSSKRSPSSAPRGGCGRASCASGSAPRTRAREQLRFHTQTAGSTLTAQQPDNNIVRVAIQALAAVLGGTQSLHCNGRDEALALPTEESARIALRTQQIIAAETGVANTVDPLGGVVRDRGADGRHRARRAGAARAHRRGRRHAGRDRAGADPARRSRSRRIARSRTSTRARTSSSASTRSRAEEPRTIDVLSIDPGRRAAAGRAACARVRASRDRAAWRGRARRRDAAAARRQRQPRPADHRRRRSAGDGRRNLRRACARCSASTRKSMSDDGWCQSDSTAAATGAGPLLSVSHLTTGFEQQGRFVPAVDRRQLSHRRGRNAGLVGESGSGKSLTALSIMRLVQPPGRIDAAASHRASSGPRPADAVRARDAARPRRRDRPHLPGADDGAQPGLHDRQPDRRDAARSTAARRAATRATRPIELLAVGAACPTPSAACATTRISSRAACGSAR